jgi:putative FmdB family regulatory protein
MPILKYKCVGCGKEFAKIFFNPEDAPRHCPVCGEGNLEETGSAFDYEQKSLDRLMCMSCETCEGEDSCSAVTSS